MHDEHTHSCSGSCSGCGTPCEHTPREELLALMNYMANHGAVQTRQLAVLAAELKKEDSPVAYEQVMAAVSDFEKGNLRLRAVLASLNMK